MEKYRKYKKYINYALPIIILLILLFNNFKFNKLITISFLISAIYYFFSFGKDDIFNPIALFSLVWLGGIALASMQLTTEQYDWKPYTWLNMIIIYLFFILGYFNVKKYFEKNNKKFTKIKNNIEIDEGKLYIIIVGVLCISYLSFFIEAYNLKFIPLFSDNMSAYIDFHYLFLHYFTLLIALVPGLTIVYKSLGGKKSIWWINLVSLIMPVLLVSRQTVLFQLILIIITFNYCIKKIKIEYLFIISAVGLILFSLASNLRQQNVDYIYQVANFKSENKTLLAQPYLYVSMNFENLRNAIENSKELHGGVYTLSPFIELFNLGNIFKYKAESFLTNQYFNTSTFALPYYLDFGIIGMIFGGYITGLISSLIYFIFSKVKNVGTVLYSIICYCIVFTFFVNFFINLNVIFDVFVLISIIVLTIKRNVRKI